jgi:hypothetical protein
MRVVMTSFVIACLTMPTSSQDRSVTSPTLSSFVYTSERAAADRSPAPGVPVVLLGGMMSVAFMAVGRSPSLSRRDVVR